MGEVIIGREGSEDCWTVDITEGSQVRRWTRLAEQSGGTVEQKAPGWTRCRIPADKLRFGLKRQVTLTDEQRGELRARFQRTGHQAKIAPAEFSTVQALECDDKNLSDEV